MNSKYIRNSIGGIILGISLLLGVGFVGTTAQAQYRNDDYYRRQRELQREQLKRQREWQREQLKRQRELQRLQQRQSRVYGVNPYGYGYGYGYGAAISADGRQTALNAGYNEGVQEGRRDRSRGERFEYRDESDYSNALVDYSSRFGNRAAYQQYFRQGFANGYRAGYEGY